MSAIPSITVTPDGSLHICDQGNLRIRSVHTSLPSLDENHEYSITSSESLEVYIFNRYGQHLTTRSLSSGSNKKTIYTFSYNVNTSFGKLSSITDSSGNKIHLFRDYANQVKSIENSKGGKCSLTMSRMKMLSSIESSDGFTYSFEYVGSSGLIKSRLDPVVSANSIFYQYDAFGRLTMALNPSSEPLSFGYSLVLEGVTVRLVKNLSDLKNNVIKRDKRSTSYLDILMDAASPEPLYNNSLSSSSSFSSSVSLKSLTSSSSLSSSLSPSSVTLSSKKPSSSSSKSIVNKNSSNGFKRETNYEDNHVNKTSDIQPSTVNKQSSVSINEQSSSQNINSDGLVKFEESIS